MRRVFVAAIVVEAQRRLTSYTDPYTGWVYLDGEVYAVRQRSPYKDSLDLDDLKSYAQLAEYVEHARELERDEARDMVLARDRAIAERDETLKKHADAVDERLKERDEARNMVHERDAWLVARERERDEARNLVGERERWLAERERLRSGTTAVSDVPALCARAT